MSITSALRNVQGIGNAHQAVSDVTGRLVGGSFWSQLKPASFRSIPFVVLNGNASFGRRNAVHEYPFRDTPWVEDLGRQARRFSVTGFLVGDDVIARRNKLIAKCEEAGDGELVHPTLGRRKVALIDFSTAERWDQGRVFEFTFVFIEQGARLYPSSSAKGAANAQGAASRLNLSALQSFKSRILAPLQQGAAVAAAVAQQASAWAQTAIQVTNDASSLMRLAAGLPGEFGRMLGQLRGITARQAKILAPARTLDALIGVAAARRTSVADLAGSFATAAQGISASTIDSAAAAAQSAASGVRAQAPSPGDAIMGLLVLVGEPAAAGAATSAAVAAQQATVDMTRRACLAELAVAAVDYRTDSADDMLGARTAVLEAFDAEISIAGDQGEDAVYREMRSLRAAVVEAMNASGAALPELTTITTGAPIPSLVLAHRLYADASRADELVARANPAHPAFMPTSFRALSQ